jgi:hypothetical protein
VAQTVARRELLAYLVGAGVAGTILIGPYIGQTVVVAVVPDFQELRHLPFFVLPLVWGAWNWARARWRLRVGIGVWGALLGLHVAAGANLFLLAQGRWFQGALLLPVAIPAFYYLLWLVLVDPLNAALGVEE